MYPLKRAYFLSVNFGSMGGALWVQSAVGSCCGTCDPEAILYLPLCHKNLFCYYTIILILLFTVLSLYMQLVGDLHHFSMPYFSQTLYQEANSHPVPRVSTGGKMKETTLDCVAGEAILGSV